MDKASYGKVDSFRAANSDDYFLIRVIACVDSTLKILGYLFTESDQTCVCGIAGLAFFKGRDSLLTYEPRGLEVRLANAKGDNAL